MFFHLRECGACVVSSIWVVAPLTKQVLWTFFVEEQFSVGTVGVLMGTAVVEPKVQLHELSWT